MIEIVDSLCADYVVISGLKPCAFATDAILGKVRLREVVTTDDFTRTGLLWARYTAFAHHNGRYFDVEAFVPVHSVDEASKPDMDILKQIKWEQESEFHGVFFELGDIIRRWKRHRGLI